MALGLKSRKTNMLAHELAAATGEDLETAVERAVAERLARIPRSLPSSRRVQIDAIFERLAAMPVLNDRAAEEVIGYDDQGLPA